MISIFPDKPIELSNLSEDIQDAGYHFDAVVKISTELSAVYTRYPLEIGVEASDHAYNEPAKMTVYGYQGSKELRISQSIAVNQLAEFGASAIVGNVNNPFLSAAAGVVGGLAKANTSHLAGSQNTRGVATMDFLATLKQKFITFDVITGLVILKNMKIDKIINNVTPENETGLEFIVEMSQLFSVGNTTPEVFTGEQLRNIDPATIQAAALLDRGRISLK